MIDEEKIRQRAYELWELEGQPEAMEHEHWRQAREQLEAEQQPPEANTLDSVAGAEQTGIAGQPANNEESGSTNPEHQAWLTAVGQSN
ncbi:MAG: hypothetical protein JWR17_4759 [Pseudomonas sp.]|uniref:DUF2934 domain-containing protein n=1 Tax=Pseudomonas sp. TaxID=306 RepID=UPI00261135CA|nr:DUF2934 domain-containing protein [Pseudomonas sp.]MDB6052013.1 hypothetical protein [Pseudomonas sp.]